MKNKINQILYDLKHQPVISWVTLTGTALSVFLIMVVVMMQQIQIMPFAPESNRGKVLYGVFFHYKQDRSNGSGGMNYDIARKLYSGLDGIKCTSYFSYDAYPCDVKGTNGEIFTANLRDVDSEFWKIFDHTLTEGRLFTPEDVESGAKVAVIDQQTASRLFGSEDASGATMEINHVPYRVIGVVKNSSPLATRAYSNVFVPIILDSRGDIIRWGDVAVALLKKEGVNDENIRKQVENRYAQVNTELATDNISIVYHEAPFDQETISSGKLYSNVAPDLEDSRNYRLLTYILLLIVPAINLSSMLHSRMRRRISEIGIRRAFGCTRARIIGDIISENFIVTLAGGIAGIIAGIIFAANFEGLYANRENLEYIEAPSVMILLNLTTIATALGICLLLNILSASIPAWQASRINPVEAINGKTN